MTFLEEIGRQLPNLGWSKKRVLSADGWYKNCLLQRERQNRHL